MTHSPADILRHALIGSGAGVLPTATTGSNRWPVFSDHMPDKPDNAVCVYNVNGISDGRLMSGKTIRHPGWQIRVRAKDTKTAWGKALDIKQDLDEIMRLSVAIEAATYTLAAVTQTSDIMDLGFGLQSEKQSSRIELTLNGTLTLI